MSDTRDERRATMIAEDGALDAALDDALQSLGFFTPWSNIERRTVVLGILSDAVERTLNYDALARDYQAAGDDLLKAHQRVHELAAERDRLREQVDALTVGKFKEFLNLGVKPGESWPDALAAMKTRAERAEAKVPDDIRSRGWKVAVHNDYTLGGNDCTFWLFTKGSVCVKGEGQDDEEALNEVRAALGDEPSVEIREVPHEASEAFQRDYAKRIARGKGLADEEQS